MVVKYSTKIIQIHFYWYLFNIFWILIFLVFRYKIFYVQFIRLLNNFNVINSIAIFTYCLLNYVRSYDDFLLENCSIYFHNTCLSAHGHSWINFRKQFFPEISVLKIFRLFVKTCNLMYFKDIYIFYINILSSTSNGFLKFFFSNTDNLL